MQDTLVERVLESDPYITGRWLGTLAHAFGAKTCTFEFAFQILLNCFGNYYIDEDEQFVRLYRSESCGILEFSDICKIELGIRYQLDFYFGV